MELLKLVAVFAIIIGIVVWKKPLWLAALAASLACLLIYWLPFGDWLKKIGTSVGSWSTLQLLLLTYVITFLQCMIKERNGVGRSQKALTDLFHNNWVTCTVAPFVVGLLPAAPAVFISGDIIDEAVGDRLTNAQKATAASFFRHIPEGFLPTYSSILIALALTGVSAGHFVLGMLPLMIIMILLGCLFLYLGRVPFKAEGEPSSHKLQDLGTFFAGLWPLIIAIVLVVAFNLNVLLSIVIVTVAYLVIGRFSFATIKPFFKQSLQLKIMANTLAIYVFKGALDATGAVSKLPEFFETLPIPAFLIFMLICFFGSIVAGGQTMATTIVPIAFASISGAGLPLLCLLMAAIYAGSQVSLTHVCLALSCDHFGVNLSDLIKTTIPIVACFLVITALYYLGMLAVLG